MNGLSGKQVIVTRAVHQASELALPLEQAGAQVILLPMLAITAPQNDGPLKRAASHVDDYDWIIFSSTNGVDALAGALSGRRQPPHARIATVGSATKEAVERLGWKVDVIPAKFVAEALIAELPEDQLQGRRILLPVAAVTRDVIPRALADLGAVVDVVEAYRNVLPEQAPAQTREVFARRPLADWITFASPSAVENLVGLTGVEPLREMRIGSIGSITSAAIRKLGLRVDAQPEEHTAKALVEAMKLCY